MYYRPSTHCNYITQYTTTHHTELSPMRFSTPQAMQVKGSAQTTLERNTRWDPSSLLIFLAEIDILEKILRSIYNKKFLFYVNRLMVK